MMENKTTTTTQKQLLLINEIDIGRCLNLSIRLFHLLHCISAVCMLLLAYAQVKDISNAMVEIHQKCSDQPHCSNSLKFASTEDVYNKIIMISCKESFNTRTHRIFYIPFFSRYF